MSSRIESRRKIYIGEQVVCTVVTPRCVLQADVLDLSQGGFAFAVRQTEAETVLRQDEKITVTFGKSDGTQFSVTGRIRNRTDVQLHQTPWWRYGVVLDLQLFRSYRDFTRDLPGRLHHCRTYLRPQVACRDPFFFAEVLLFQVNGFTPHGVDLIVSSRCKTLLPNLPLSLDVFIPGRGQFSVEARVSPRQYHSGSLNRFRIFAEYVHASPAYHEAVAEYLVMFARNVSPVSLQREGFRLGNLDHAIEVQCVDQPTDFEYFQPSVIGVPAPKGVDDDAFTRFSRKMLCKIGPEPVASCRLIFVEQDPIRSELRALGHRVPSYIISEGHLELSRLLVAPAAELRHFFIPLLRHVVRIALQANIRYLLLEGTDQIRPLMETIGFKVLLSKVKRSYGARDLELHLMNLSVEAALANRDFKISQTVWKRMYEGLHDYLATSLSK